MGTFFWRAAMFVRAKATQAPRARVLIVFNFIRRAASVRLLPSRTVIKCFPRILSHKLNGAKVKEGNRRLRLRLRSGSESVTGVNPTPYGKRLPGSYIARHRRLFW